MHKFLYDKKVLFLEDSKFGLFDDADSFASYCKHHFLPMLEDVAKNCPNEQTQNLADYLAENLKTIINQIEE
jgi:hypothetical protein